MRIIGIFLALALFTACGEQPQTMAPSFDITAPMGVHLDTLIVVNEGFFTEAHNETYADLVVQASLADVNGPISVGSTLPADIVCYFHINGLPTTADALGSPARCGWATYLEMPKGKRKGVTYTVTFDSLVGSGYVYNAAANEAPSTVTLRLR